MQLPPQRLPATCTHALPNQEALGQRELPGTKAPSVTGRSGREEDTCTSTRILGLSVTLQPMPSSTPVPSFPTPRAAPFAGLGESGPAHSHLSSWVTRA